jgi:hypothetical protein
VACIGENINAYVFAVGEPERKSPLRRPDIRERMILKCILDKRMEVCGLYSSDSGQVTSGRLL